MRKESLVNLTLTEYAEKTVMPDESEINLIDFSECIAEKRQGQRE